MLRRSENKLKNMRIFMQLRPLYHHPSSMPDRIWRTHLSTWPSLNQTNPLPTPDTTPIQTRQIVPESHIKLLPDQRPHHSLEFRAFHVWQITLLQQCPENGISISQSQYLPRLAHQQFIHEFTRHPFMQLNALNPGVGRGGAEKYDGRLRSR